MQEKKIPYIFYLYIHSKLAKRSNGFMSLKEAVTYLHEWRLPKEIRVAIIKEMEILGLVKKVDRHSIIVFPSTFDVTNTNKIYELVGIL